MTRSAVRDAIEQHPVIGADYDSYERDVIVHYSNIPFV